MPHRTVLCHGQGSAFGCNPGGANNQGGEKCKTTQNLDRWSLVAMVKRKTRRGGSGAFANDLALMAIRDQSAAST